MFKKTITFERAYDKRDHDPAKNYGIHGVNIRFVLQGPGGATQFLLFTNWHLPEVEIDSQEPMPADLGYHSPTPRYEGQDHNAVCDLLGMTGCYYDGSGLRAEPVYEALLREGSDGVWRILEEEYDSLFEAAIKIEGE